MRLRRFAFVMVIVTVAYFMLAVMITPPFALVA